MSNRTSVFLTVGAIVLSAVAAYGVGVYTTTGSEYETVVQTVEVPGAPELPACVSEDSEDCYWDAAIMGNGGGTSFVRWGGVTYYPEADVVVGSVEYVEVPVYVEVPAEPVVEYVEVEVPVVEYLEVPVEVVREVPVVQTVEVPAPVVAPEFFEDGSVRVEGFTGCVYTAMGCE